MPSAGLAVMPESASEPPHSSAEAEIASIGAGRRRRAAAAATRRSTSGSTARTVPGAAAAAGEREELDAIGRARCGRRPARVGRRRRGRSARVAATFGVRRRSRAARARCARGRASDPRPVQSWLTATAPGMPARDLLGRGTGARRAAGSTRTWLRNAPAPVARADSRRARTHHMLIARRSSANTREPRASAAVCSPAEHGEHQRPQRRPTRRAGGRGRSRRRARRAARESPGDGDHRADRRSRPARRRARGNGHDHLRPGRGQRDVLLRAPARQPASTVDAPRAPGRGEGRDGRGTAGRRRRRVGAGRCLRPRRAPRSANAAASGARVRDLDADHDVGELKAARAARSAIASEQCAADLDAVAPRTHASRPCCWMPASSTRCPRSRDRVGQRRALARSRSRG